MKTSSYPMNFVLDQKANINFSSFCRYTIDIDIERLEEKFGSPIMDGEVNKGYQYQYRFRRDDDVVTLYDRNGMWRIGGYDMEVANDFHEWLAHNFGDDS